MCVTPVNCALRPDDDPMMDPLRRVDNLLVPTKEMNLSSVFCTSLSYEYRKINTLTHVKQP